MKPSIFVNGLSKSTSINDINDIKSLKKRRFFLYGSVFFDVMCLISVIVLLFNEFNLFMAITAILFSLISLGEFIELSKVKRKIKCMNHYS